MKARPAELNLPRPPRLILAVQNRQREKRVHTPQLRRFIQVLLRDCLQLQEVELGVTLVAAPVMARMNWEFLQHEGATDIITFDHSEVQSSRRGAAGTVRPVHGELWICVSEAVAQARRYRVSWTQELARYVVHGVLHLLGHDDQRPAPRRAMKRAEAQLLRRVAGRFDLRLLDRDAAGR